MPFVSINIVGYRPTTKQLQKIKHKTQDSLLEIEEIGKDTRLTSNFEEWKKMTGCGVGGFSISINECDIEVQQRLPEVSSYGQHSYL